MISGQTLRVCPAGKPVPTHRVVARGHAFPDHALASPFANCHVIVRYGGAGLFDKHLVDKHLASTIHCVDDEIFGSLQRREQRRRARAVMPHSNPGGD